MGHHNLLNGQAVTLHHRHHVVDIVAGIDDDCFLGLVIAHDGAIALQRAHRENLVNHKSKLPRSGLAILANQLAAGLS